MEEMKKNFQDEVNDSFYKQSELIARLVLRISALERVLIESGTVNPIKLGSITEEIAEDMNKALLNAIEQFGKKESTK